jgi:hypothetical protein
MSLFSQKNTLYCFSPPVMLATFIFEIGAALYVMWRYHMNTSARLITALLICLGVFQLSEYMLCGGLGLKSFEWARLGYISITLLPALCIYLAAVIAKKNVKPLIIAAYTSAAACALYFALTPGAINGHECRPNYAVFDFSQVSLIVYSVYYYGWLVAGTVLSYVWSKEATKRRAPLLWLTAGYLLFMAPTTTVNILYPETLAGIPSIMCGFAVLLAVVLVTRIAPHTSKLRERSKHLEKKANI